MNSNSFLLSFGMKPEDFERTDGPISPMRGSSTRHGRQGRAHPVPSAVQKAASSRPATPAR